MNNLGNGQKKNPLGAQAIQAPQLTAEMIKNAANITCECGGMVFSEKLLFKKMSALISTSGREEIAPMPIMVCDKCGKVPQVFDPQNVLPSEIKTTKVL